jgi:Cutinase
MFRSTGFAWRRTVALGAATLALGAGTAAATTLTAAPASATASAAKCAPVVVITARGTAEKAGNGALGSLANAIRSSSAKGVRIAPLSYPATAANYFGSVAKGAANLRATLLNLATACPASKTVLLGYSQGAEVVGDTLDNKGAQLSARAAANVKAVLLYGDPTFVAGRGYDRGSFAKSRSGVFPRPASALNKFAPRLASYCDANDMFCQAGGKSMAVHQGYFAKYNAQAAKWVVAKTG